MKIQDYLKSVEKRFKAGISREHSYRGDLQQLLESLLPGLLVTNEPARVACGAPDYILTKKGVPVGFIEAKDIGEPLDGKKKHKEQFDRYKASLPNLIFTDYLNFRLYVDGELVTSIRLAEINGNKVVPLTDNFNPFTNLISDFGVRTRQTIRSPKKLAEMMAGKARILADVLDKALTSDEETEANTSLKEQMDAFKKILIHDIDPKQFADIYSQTIAYGMFAARLHDPNLDTFTRQEAASLIPKTNPFLRKLFQYIAGYDLDDRIVWIVDGLADLFRATDVSSLLKNFGKATESQDPIIHFYETFLSEYDPKLRKSRGVWYTPEPVVNFIVRAVDDILKSEFGLQQGLADNSKTKITLKIPTHDKRFKDGQREYEQEVHKVQILDPATGTGTFLAEVIMQIYNKFEGQKGVWSNYVENHLIPRLNGFELLMASYAMAHLKLDMLLTETGYNPTRDQRLRVYLTNSLEEHHPETGTLFASWLSNEANEANHIKRDNPVMVVLGNPPYSGESSNKGNWINNLIDIYKKEPGGKEKLKERNIKWLNNDYVKFIRYGQYFIEKNGEGILAFINPHSYSEDPTFRGMRWSLLKAFDKIYVLDLHGNLKKREKAKDGSADINVFDIEPGVCINIFIKKKSVNKNLAEVYHYDMFGKREDKYNFLLDNDLDKIQFKKLKHKDPFYFLSNKDLSFSADYDKGFSLVDLLKENSLGVLSKNDQITISYKRSELEEIINDFSLLNESELRNKHSIKKDSRDWVLSNAIKDIKENYSRNDYRLIEYRPFDLRWTYFSGTPKGFFAYSQKRIMNNIKDKENHALICGRQGQAVGQMQWNLIFVTNEITDQNIFRRGGGTVFPLYIYPEESIQQNHDDTPERKPNLNPKIVKKFTEELELTFTPEKEETESTLAPIDLLDYIYAVLHSPTYREKFKEFLKIDFPRVPYPKDPDTFWQLVELGGELRRIHLLEHSTVSNFITTYPVGGNNAISNRLTKTDPGFELTDKEQEIGKVWINDSQYFDNVPLIAWEFNIGGYPPAQKWLKDRIDRQLSFDEIQHYQKIIAALSETDRLMKEINQIELE